MNTLPRINFDHVSKRSDILVVIDTVFSGNVWRKNSFEEMVRWKVTHFFDELDDILLTFREITH